MPNHTPTVLRRRAHWHCTKDTYGVTTFCRVRHRFMGTARQHWTRETADLFLTGIATCYLGREGCDETRRAHEVEGTKASTLAALRGGAPITGGGPELDVACMCCGRTGQDMGIGDVCLQCWRHSMLPRLAQGCPHAILGPPIAGGGPELDESLSCPAGRDHVLNGRRFCATACDPTDSCDHVRCAVLASEHRTAERIRARGPHALGYRRPS